MATQSQPQPQRTFPTSLIIRDEDLANALESLRTTPAVELSAVRSLRIVLTEANLLHWHGSIWPGMDLLFNDEDLVEYARLYPAPASISTNSPSKVFRALLRFVAGNFDLQTLDLQVNASNAAWSFFEDTIAGAYGGDIDEEWKFIYEFYVDVGRALADVFGGSDLRELGVETSIWDGMGPWLVGQISGKETVVADILPKYHDAGTRLTPNEPVRDGVNT